MAGNVSDLKVVRLLKLRIGLTGKCHVTCQYSYNLPLWAIKKNSGKSR